MARKRKNVGLSQPPPRPLGIEVDEELDLHGMALDEAMAAVDQMFARQKIHPGALVRIIHGHSNSTPESIRRRLRLNLETIWKRKVKRFRIDFQNPGATLLEVSGG